MSTWLGNLPEYPFPRLRALLAGVEPPAGIEPVNMSIGAPRHPIPEFIRATLDETRSLYTNYPPAAGSEEFRLAIRDWLQRRFQLPDGFIDPARNIAPVCGTREALFNIGLLVVGSHRDASAPALVLIPNPFYQAYAAATLAGGGEPRYLPALPENGWLPDYDSLSAADWQRVRFVYLCSPANPQGAVADLEYLKKLILKAREFNFVLAVDECYCEIYTEGPPPGVLQACAELGTDLSQVLAFHSLSKRSNVPGLRSGFVAGDPSLIAAYLKFKEFGGSVLPEPVLAASTLLWSEESHVEENRRLYRQKFELAESIFGNRFGFYRPDGGFFLWLDVGDGEAAARQAWQAAGVLALPGKYLTAPAPGVDPGAAYLRLALVGGMEETEQGLRRLAEVLA